MKFARQDMTKLAIAMALGSVAGMAAAADQTPTATAAPTATPATTITAATAAAVTIPAPPAGMSQVVFYRPGAMGMAISCNIRENGKMLGTTNNGRYFVLTTTPGPHKYTTKSEVTDELNVEAEADETTYVKCKITMGIMAGRPNLSPSTAEEFASHAAKIKPSDPDKMARTIAADEEHRGAATAH